MRTITMIAFFALALEAKANLKMANLNKMVHPGVIGRPISITPQQRFPYGVSALREFSPAFRTPLSSVPYSRMTVVGAEETPAKPAAKAKAAPKAAAKAAPKAAAKAAPKAKDGAIETKEAAEKKAEAAGPLNVYGEKLQKCNSDDDCVYSTDASPMVCATKVTRNFSPNQNVWLNKKPGWKPNYPEKQKKWTDSFKWTKNPGADVWQEFYVGKCISLWDVGAESGFFGQTGLSWRPKEQGYGVQFGFVPTDYLVKCDALPQDVLTSSFSLDLFRSCYRESKAYKFVSKTSSAYKAGANTYTTQKDLFKINKPSLNEETPNALSGKCFRFRASIENICYSCAEQTTKAGSKKTLEGFCSAIEGTQSPEEAELMAEMAPDVLGLTTTFLVSLFAGSAITLVLSRFRRRLQTAAEQPLLD